MYNKALAKMEDDNKAIRDIRRKIQLLQHEKESLEAFQQRASDLEKEVHELRQLNAQMEDEMTKLCMSPFTTNTRASATCRAAQAQKGL